MHLIAVGLSHKTAPIAVRERMCLAEDAVSAALVGLAEAVPVTECLIISTCNRLEVYACIESRAEDAAIVEWLSEHFGTDRESLTPHLYYHAGHKAAEHLFRVSAGIDSMVVGEAQILGQLKNAYAVAHAHGFTGPVLNSLFQQAIVVGKQVRADTDIGKGAFSVGSVAVQLAGSIFDRLSGCAVLVIGAGKMGELAVVHLAAAGVRNIMVANRTYTKAVQVAEKHGGRAVEFEEVSSLLCTADIVISSTGSGDPIITRNMVLECHRARRGRPLFLIDMAVPRDVESEVGALDNVFLYNIDDLQSVVAADMAGRHDEITSVEEIVASQVQEFLRWFRVLDAVPVISALRDKFDVIRSSEYEKLISKLPDLRPDQREAVDKALRSVVNRICHTPMLRIKEYAVEQADSDKLQTICDVFGICPSEDTADKKPGED